MTTPETTQRCNLGSCPYVYRQGPWGDVSQDIATYSIRISTQSILSLYLIFIVFKTAVIIC